MKKVKIELEVYDDFEPHYCDDCPLSYYERYKNDDDSEFESHCVLNYCPFEEMKEKEPTMTSKEALKWLDAVINKPEVCGGNLEDNNKALKTIKTELEIFELLQKYANSIDLILENGNITFEEYVSQCFTCDTMTQEEFDKILHWKDKE